MWFALHGHRISKTVFEYRRQNDERICCCSLFCRSHWACLRSEVWALAREHFLLTLWVWAVVRSVSTVWWQQTFQLLLKMVNTCENKREQQAALGDILQICGSWRWETLQGTRQRNADGCLKLCSRCGHSILVPEMENTWIYIRISAVSQLKK